MDSIKYPNRKSIRLKRYDYTQSGAYFVTICVHKMACLFGEIRDATMKNNELAQIVYDEWKKSETIRSEIEMGPFVVMPNHLHGIVFIKATHNVGSDRQVARSAAGPQPASLGAFIAGFKSSATKKNQHNSKNTRKDRVAA